MECLKTMISNQGYILSLVYGDSSDLSKFVSCT